MRRVRSMCRDRDISGRSAEKGSLMSAHCFARTLWTPRSKCNDTRTKSTASDPGIRAVCAVLLLMLAAISLAHGQNPQIVPCPTPGSQDLLTIPEIARTPDGVFRATIMNVDGLRTVWGSVGITGKSTTDTRCASQYMRYYIGTDT